MMACSRAVKASSHRPGCSYVSARWLRTGRWPTSCFNTSPYWVTASSSLFCSRRVL